MGLFDFMKKNKEVSEKSKIKEEEIHPVGWDSITAVFTELYPENSEPVHIGTNSPMYLGGKDALEGVSAYDDGEYWHFVSYGLTELYDKQSRIKKVSGFGYEFTFKFKKGNYDNELLEIMNIAGILQSLAGVVRKGVRFFQPYDFIYTGQKSGMDSTQKSKIKSLILVPDSTAKSIDTPNGKVDFLCFVGINDEKVKQIQNKEKTVKEVYEEIGSDVTCFFPN